MNLRGIGTWTDRVPGIFIDIDLETRLAAEMADLHQRDRRLVSKLTVTVRK